MFEGSEGASLLAVNPGTTPNSKHIDVYSGALEFKIVHVPTTFQRADFLTKPLHKECLSNAP